MSRKKKELITNVDDEVSQVGNVTIQVIDNGKISRSVTLHNKATQKLCRYIRDCLIGNNVWSSRPGRIAPCVESSSKLTPMFNYGILYEKDTEEISDTDTSSQATLSFIIPYTVISGKVIDGFKLYSIDDSLTEYAEVNLKNKGKSITLENNKSNLRVSWTLKISPK